MKNFSLVSVLWISFREILTASVCMYVCKIHIKMLRCLGKNMLHSPCCYDFEKNYVCF